MKTLRKYGILELVKSNKYRFDVLMFNRSINHSHRPDTALNMYFQALQDCYGESTILTSTINNKRNTI